MGRENETLNTDHFPLPLPQPVPSNIPWVDALDEVYAYFTDFKPDLKTVFPLLFEIDPKWVFWWQGKGVKCILGV